MKRYIMIGVIVLVGGVGLWLGTRSTPPPVPPEPITAPEVPEIEAPEPVEEPPVEQAPTEEPPVEEPPIEQTPAEETLIEEAPGTGDDASAQPEAGTTVPSAVPDATPSMTDESAIPEAPALDGSGDDTVGDLTDDATGLESLTADSEMPADMDQNDLRTLIEGADGLSAMQRNSLLLLLESAGENRALLEEVYRSAVELRGN